MCGKYFKICSYQPSDKDSILEIFQSNCPKYFHTSDEGSLVDFLEKYADKNFLVVRRAGAVIGCGCHYVRQKAKIIGIAWVMFTRNSLGVRIFQTVADMLFDGIMARIKAENLQYEITINTTQVMETLFHRYGFVTKERRKGGFGGHLDHLVMKRHVETTN